MKLSDMFHKCIVILRMDGDEAILHALVNEDTADLDLYDPANERDLFGAYFDPNQKVQTDGYGIFRATDRTGKEHYLYAYTPATGIK